MVDEMFRGDKAALKAACGTMNLEELKEAVSTASRSVQPTDADLVTARNLLRVIMDLTAAQWQKDPGWGYVLPTLAAVVADKVLLLTRCAPSCHG